MDKRQQDPESTAETAEAPADDDCLLCDKVLAIAGLGVGLIVVGMAVDLLTGGAISARLFGSRRDAAVWDTADPGDTGPPEHQPAAEGEAAAGEAAADA